MHNIKSITKKDRYGNMFSFEMFEDKSVPLMIMVPDMPNGFNGADTDNHPGNPKGTDTVPAWLTPGENVVNAEASRIPGNQEKIDQMNEQGRQMQAAQGGPIPSYAAGGMQIPRPDGMLNSLSNRLGDRNGGPMYAATGDFITDALLDRIRRIESNGNANATSEAGAMGQYQIMPSTAADPGMGVTPLAAEDIRDPVKSREFARKYLKAIAAYNPDFTEDEVITAYHSGTGNVRKAKAGTEALGPRGRAYAGKVNNAKVPPQNDFPSELTKRGLVPSDLFQANQEPGMMSAMAQTNAKADKGNVGVNDEIIRNGVSYKYNKAKDEYIDAEGREYTRGLGEFISDTGRNIGDYFSNTNPNPNYGAKEGEVLVGERNGDSVYRTVDGSFVQLAGPDKKRLGLSSFNTEDEIVFNDIPEDERQVVPKPDEEYKGLLTLNGKTKIVNQIIAQTDTGDNPDQPPVTQGGDINAIAEAGLGLKDQDPGFFQQSVSVIKDVLGDMFSSKDIARIAIQYVGSRALGYAHNGSLNYAMKEFAMNKKLQQKQEFELIKANAKNYTTASYNKYIQTRDINVLIKKPGKSTPGDYYIIPGMSGMQASINVDGVPMVDVKVDGKVVRVNAAELGARKVRDENSPIKLAESFDKAATTAFKRINKNVEEAKQLVPLTSLGGQARDLVEADIVREGSDTTNQGRIRTAMKRAIDKYADAMRRYADDTSSFQGRDPSIALEVFYRQERISVDNPGFDNKLIKDADPYKLADLMNTVQAEVDREQDDAKAEFNIMSKRWKKIIERKRQNSSYDMGGFDSKRNDGHTPFTWWMTQVYANNPTAEQLYNDNK